MDWLSRGRIVADDAGRFSSGIHDVGRSSVRIAVTPKTKQSTPRGGQS